MSSQKARQSAYRSPRPGDVSDKSLLRALQQPMAGRQGGSRLPDDTRKDLESRFGYDFSPVRVYSDDGAARAMGARAFAEGNNITFAAGQYAPHTPRGRRLLAHELAHVVQQPGVIARSGGSAFDDPAWQRARQQALRYEPRLRPHVPTAPRIPTPPAPTETAPPVLPAQCPQQSRVRSELTTARAVDVTADYMQRQINIARHQTATSGVTFTPDLLRRADGAIRATFGHLIRRGPRVSDPGSTTVLSPSAFAQSRVPTQAEAEQRVGTAVIEVARDGEDEMERRIQDARQGRPSTSAPPAVTTSLLRSLCIGDGNDPNLLSFVVRPLVQQKGLPFVRDWEAARIGGQTRFPSGGSPQVDIPDRIRNLGHIMVHEAMHFYVHNRYRATAEADPRREDVLMEGGAEYLTRHVIHTRLSNRPEFTINYSSRGDQFRFVTNYIARGGIDAFALAYFTGQVELIGLPARPKSAVTSPGDAIEREADRIAAAALGEDN